MTEVDWSHWLTHRALMWTRPLEPYHPLISDFEGRMVESQQERCRWNALVLPEGQLVGEAVLRNQDDFGDKPEKAHVLDIYVHPGFV